MRIHLVRHAHCVGGGFDDFERYLTLEGRTAAQRTGEALVRQESKPSTILTSPLVRAVQTAEIISGALGFAGELRVSATMYPGAAPDDLTKELEQMKGDVIAVGHMPDMRARAVTLLDAEYRLVPSFSRGMVMTLARDDAGERWSFDWAFLPRTREVYETLAELREHC